MKESVGAGGSAVLHPPARDCASLPRRLVFCSRLRRLEKAGVEHTGLLSPSAPPNPVRLEINPNAPPYGVLGLLCVVLAKIR